MNKTLKSILSLVLCVCFVLALSACGRQNNDTTANNTDTNASNNNVTDDNTDDSADITPEESTAGDSNILVAFANTDGGRLLIGVKDNGKIAGVRSEEEKYMIETAAQLYCIPEVEYTEDDVFDRAQDELNNGTRPPLSSHIDQEVMEQYDVIFVGFPIWWYVAPRIISTFVESYDFSGKTMVPFATSGGSGMGRTVDELKKLCPDADWKAGKMVNGASERELADWANKF